MSRRQTPNGLSFTKPQAKTFAITALAAALLVPGFASPASATTTCPAGSTLVGNGICEVVFTTPGETTWTVPANVTSIEALLVGAGGASDGYYGGGGGDVKVVTLQNSGDISLVVGAGGTYADSGSGEGGASSATQGSASEESAGGTGKANFSGGTSGSGIISQGFGGSGAGAASTDQNGGAGIEVASLTSLLFTQVSDCVGGGGSSWSESDTTASCGGGYFTNFVANEGSGPWTPDTGSINQFAPVLNSGGGASALVVFDVNARYDTLPRNGADGKVVIRFTVSDQLANTGESNLPLLLGSAFALAAAGAGVMTIGRRRRA